MSRISRVKAAEAFFPGDSGSTNRIPLGAISAPFMLQDAIGQTTGASETKIVWSNTLKNAVQQGNSLLLVGASEQTTNSITAVTDNLGNAWQQVNQVKSSSGEPSLNLDIWLATNCAAGVVALSVTVEPAGFSYTVDASEWNGLLELDTIQTVNSAKIGPGRETTANLTESSPFLKAVPKAVCEALEAEPAKGVGLGVQGGSIPELSDTQVVPTIVKVETAKEEVKISFAPTKTEAGVAVKFGPAAVKAPSLTLTAGDVVLLNYSGRIGTRGETVKQIKPEPKAILGLKGFNANGFDAYWINPTSPIKVEIPLPVPPLLEELYSLQVASFKFAPGNRGVAGTNAAGELFGAISGSTGKLNTAVNTAIPGFVNVGPGNLEKMLATGFRNETLFEAPAGGSAAQWRFEASATDVRLRGKLKVKAGKKVNGGVEIFSMPTAYIPPTTVLTNPTFAVAYGADVYSLNNHARATLNATETPVSNPNASTEIGSAIVKGFTKAEIEKVKVGQTVQSGAFPSGTTVVETKPATAEVKVSENATETNPSIAVQFGLPLGGVALGKGTTVEASEIISFDGTYPMT